ncbi:hypothetical protein [Microbacterium sp. cf332]|uniref:hypothetical protein n=1 Tax=Microbacterium sp. cf332 TaxID=1761804 RepID=UPI000B847882|nr:hypothetical protein [Microbacterium sp. cf332]
MDELKNALDRREILAAYVIVLGRLHDLIDLCEASSGESTDLRVAVQEAFDLGPVAADAVLSLQVRRFSPGERRRVEDELDELDARIARLRTRPGGGTDAAG